MDRKKAFKERVRDWSQKLDVEVVWLGVRPMRRKWASCSTKGHLNFSVGLLNKDQKFQDYVIVHELLHSRRIQGPVAHANAHSLPGTYG